MSRALLLAVLAGLLLRLGTWWLVSPTIVQGDERDVIVISVCYGPDKQGRMRMNFGPINRSGGEKRLNVIFSRAKEHVALVSTIKGDTITNDYNTGALCLKTYLKFADAVSRGDQEAMRAIRAAQPILKTADQVEVVMVEPRRTNDASAPGFALMAMLTRQGVNAILSPISKTADTVSDTLRQKALEMGADMIVMGAYGHSRFRERLLGGATREMLAKAEVPVMMTH